MSINYIKNFSPRFDHLKDIAQDESGYEIYQYQGLNFHGIKFPDLKQEWDTLRNAVGEIEPVKGFIRKYEKHQEQNTFIHTDEVVADFSTTMSISSPPVGAGTMIWDRLTGFPRAVKKLEDEENLLWILPTNFPHSRWPRDWIYNEPRIILVLFFNLVNNGET